MAVLMDKANHLPHAMSSERIRVQMDGSSSCLVWALVLPMTGLRGNPEIWRTGHLLHKPIPAPTRGWPLAAQGPRLAVDPADGADCSARVSSPVPCACAPAPQPGSLQPLSKKISPCNSDIARSFSPPFARLVAVNAILPLCHPFGIHRLAARSFASPLLQRCLL